METPTLSIRSRLVEAWHNIPYLSRGLRLAWDAAPRLTIGWMALLAVQGLLPALTVLLARPLVDGLAAAMAAGGDWAAVRPVLGLGLGMAGLLLAGELLRGAAAFLHTAQSEQVSEHISRLIHNQSVAVDLAFYDQPAYFDHLHRARYEAGYRPMALLESLGGLLRNSITLAGMAAVLLPYGWWLAPLLLLSTLPALAVVLRHTVRQHQWRVQYTADERRTWYYDWLLTDREVAAELRLFGLGSVFKTAYQSLRTSLRQGRLRLVREQSLASLGASAAGLLAAGGALAWMVWRALQGQASLGDLALFYQAFNQGQGLLRALLEELARVYGNSLFLGDLFEFLELKSQLESPPASLGKAKLIPAYPAGVAVRFHQVHFSYPGSERPALAGLDLEIPAGQIAAIVGANGAGKSTLAKLLCRFYDPNRGRVELGGIDLRELPLETVRGQVSALFQVPVHYSGSVADNIRMFDETTPEPALHKAAEAAGAGEVIARLPHGYDTQLGTWFKGGTDLSVGEWQRLALARAFLRPTPVMVLDEPTSAMDPWAEAGWLQALRAAANGRTVLLITHRLTTAMSADMIHVLAGGRVVESGTHAGLLASGGAYARSWYSQQVGPSATT